MPNGAVPVRARFRLRLSLPLLAGLWGAVPALAQPAISGPGQDLPAPSAPTAAAPPTRAVTSVGQAVQPGEAIDFSADQMIYDDKTDVVTATGDVYVARGDSRMRANSVTYDRKTGKVDARGEVVVIDAEGNKLIGDRAQVTESLKDAVVENLLLVLEDGGRAAAQRATRVNGIDTLNRAVYSPCSVVDGCKVIKPLWSIKALRVVHDPYKKRFYYRGASFDVAGVPILYLPRFSHPDGGAANAGGFLTPDARYDRLLGLTLITPYHVPLAPNADLTVTPYIFSDALPMLGAEYRRLTSFGPFKLGGLMTVSREFATDPATGRSVGQANEVRGYIYANGQFQLSPEWRITTAIRATSDTSFLRRYDVTFDDVLRNFVRAERFGDESYLSIEGWAFEGLRPTDRGDQTPIVLPLIDWRWRPSVAILGGHLDFVANTLVVTRTGAEDTQRALAQARYIALLTTPLGQRITFTGQVRADAYHTSDAQALDQQQYAGTNGWHGRVIPAAALDVEWPFAGPALGGVQTITPRVQVVASPFEPNGTFPNEDARAIDLTENNLFDINRFPGYDRWEGGERVTYGLTYTLDRSHVRVSGELGQSYQFRREPGLFPSGTGLTERFSDIVGRATIQIGSFVSLTDRFRLDRSDLKIRRQEADVTLGTARDYIQFAYSRLNRNLAVEDSPDHTEARATARVQVLRHWSAFASTILDLTSTADDPAGNRGAFQPIRHRFGVAYDDECFSFSFSWRRDYVTVPDRPAGNSFLVRVAFKNLGR